MVTPQKANTVNVCSLKNKQQQLARVIFSHSVDIHQMLTNNSSPATRSRFKKTLTHQHTITPCQGVHLFEKAKWLDSKAVSSLEGNLQVADGPLEAAVVCSSGGRGCSKLSSQRQGGACGDTCTHHTLIWSLLKRANGVWPILWRNVSTQSGVELEVWLFCFQAKKLKPNTPHSQSYCPVSIEQLSDEVLQLTCLDPLEVVLLCSAHSV